MSCLDFYVSRHLWRHCLQTCRCLHGSFWPVLHVLSHSSWMTFWTSWAPHLFGLVAHARMTAWVVAHKHCLSSVPCMHKISFNLSISPLVFCLVDRPHLVFRAPVIILVLVWLSGFIALEWITMMSLEVSPLAWSASIYVLTKSLNWVTLQSNLTICLSWSESVDWMYVMVDLESMVIWDIIFSRNVGPSSIVFWWVPFLMVIAGSIPLFSTLSAHSSDIEFLMHTSICWDICASLVSFIFPLDSRMYYFLALLMHSSIAIFPYLSKMHLPLIHISMTTLWQLPILQLLYEHLHLVQAPVIQFVTEFYDGSLTLFPTNASGAINAGIHDLTGCESIFAFASRRNSL